jgi:hypothetical protein
MKPKHALLGLSLIVGLSVPGTAQQSLPCDAFRRAADGTWIAIEASTAIGPNGPIEIQEGQVAGDELRELLETQCGTPQPTAR